MTTNGIDAPAPAVFPVFKSYNGLTRDNIAVLLTRAASILDEHGWTNYPDYEGYEGHDIRGALKMAADWFISTTYARRPHRGELDDFADELETRIGGALLVAGIAGWGTAPHAVGNFQSEAALGNCTAWAQYRTAADMIALLNLTSQMTCLTWE